jgi:hypothetical protein
MTGRLNEFVSVLRTSEIVVFPIAARAGDIDRCATELDRLQGEDALRFWKTECRGLADALSSLGVEEAKVRQQVMNFQDEVQAELVRRHQSRAISQSRAERQKKR